MGKTAVISGMFPNFSKRLKDLGFETIELGHYKNQTKNPEAAHPDMQMLKIDRTTMVLLKNNNSANEKITEKLKNTPVEIYYTEEEIGEFNYPDCVKLNVAVVGKYAIGNFKIGDAKVMRLIEQHGLEPINVKQGYAKCSSAVVGDSAVITSDESIVRGVKGKIDCLKISSGGIALCERYGGFIGGASFLADKSTLVFMGDIKAHPDYINIKSFCLGHGVNVESLSADTLCDVGGVVIL